jgi:ATP-binding protein involved in chromosome partitioning
MFIGEKLKVPIIGLVENMSWFTPEELPDNKYYIFGKDGGRNLADQLDLNFLGQIPLVQSIREGGDKGLPAIIGDNSITSEAFAAFADETIRAIAVANAAK